MAPRNQQQEFIGTLTEDDVRVLKQLIRDVHKLRVNSQLHDYESGSQSSPETYSAITLAEIPALTNVPYTGTATSSGTAGEGDTPGSGDCLLYKINKSTIKMDSLPMRITVYNISTSAIPADTLIIVTRDKFGNWMAVVGGGSGGSRIRFTITSADCAAGTAVGTVLSRSLNTSDIAIGASVNLCDADGCFLVGDPDLLPGRVGWAEQMEGVTCGGSTGTGTATGTGGETSHWAIFQLCTPDVEC